MVSRKGIMRTILLTNPANLDHNHFNELDLYFILINRLNLTYIFPILSMYNTKTKTVEQFVRDYYVS